MEMKLMFSFWPYLRMVRQPVLILLTILVWQAGLIEIATAEQTDSARDSASTVSAHPENDVSWDNSSDAEKARNFSNQLFHYYVEQGKEKGPAWLRTTDLNWGISASNKPEYSFETVQPLGNIGKAGQQWFMQGRYAYTSDSSTGNLGIGWRKLSSDKESIFGLNMFYDYGFKYNLERIGIGTEYFNKLAEYRMNFYYPLSGDRLTGISYETSGTLYSYIRAVEGLDYEVGTSFRHIPGLKAYAGGYYWNNQHNDDEKGYRVRTTMQVTPQVNLEVGYADSNLSHGLYGNIRYQLAFDSSKAGNKKPSVLSNDISHKLLQRVDRENDIKTETWNKFVTNITTGNIQVTVTNSLGLSVSSGATVQAYQNGIAIGSSAVTDSTGEASLSGLAPGSYIIKASYTYDGVTYTSTGTATVTKNTTTSINISLGFSATLPIMLVTGNGTTLTPTGNSYTFTDSGKTYLFTLSVGPIGSGLQYSVTNTGFNNISIKFYKDGTFIFGAWPIWPGSGAAGHVFGSTTSTIVKIDITGL
jgi:hypothetical protein